MCISAKMIQMGICMIDQAFNFYGSATGGFFAIAGNCVQQGVSRPVMNLKPNLGCLTSHVSFLRFDGLI